MSESSKRNFYSFTYVFQLENDASYTYDVKVDKESLLSDYSVPEEPPEWTKLAFKKCDGCALEDQEYCPIALRLVEPMETLYDLISYGKADIKVITDERDYEKSTDVQDGVRSLFGLIMATSECPSMKPFRPMARFHLPFSSVDETVYRVTSMYLLKQFLNHQEETHIPFNINNLQSLYEVIHHVNAGITERILSIAEKDSTLNAITILDAFASMVPIMVEKKLNKLEHLFS